MNLKKPGKSIRSHSLILLGLTWLAISCAHVKVPNVKACAVAGSLQNGMDCAYTLSSETSQMDAQEMIAFLEPDPINNKGAAICQASEDWGKIKTALEQACKQLKKRCSYEIKEAIITVDQNIRSIDGLN